MRTTNYRSEIEIRENGIFLTVDSTIKSSELVTLILLLEKEGWQFLNNGAMLSDGTDAFLYFKAF